MFFPTLVATQLEYLSRCRPGQVVWRFWAAQLPGLPSRRCCESSTERRANTIGVNAAAGDVGRCRSASASRLNVSTSDVSPVLSPEALVPPGEATGGGVWYKGFFLWRPLLAR